jgi:signal transduction histidine kinase
MSRQGEKRAICGRWSRIFCCEAKVLFRCALLLLTFASSLFMASGRAQQASTTHPAVVVDSTPRPAGISFDELASQSRIARVIAKTLWVRVICAVFVIAAFVLLYELRLRKLSRQFNMRLQERMGERTRDARELHDGLLQSFQGAMLLFQRVRNLLPDRPLEAAAALEDALVRADVAITESRNALRDLGASMLLPNDLAPAITALGKELGTADAGVAAVKFRLVIEGASHNLDPILRDELYCIAREALRNAYRHAHARQIEAEISYGSSVLRLRIRDDGIGIDSKVLEQGSRSGKGGLPGMHQRAERIGAQLSVWSRPGLGTEVDLSIPAALAYLPSPVRAGSRLFRRKAEKTHEC